MTENADIFRFERDWRKLDELFRSGRKPIEDYQFSRLKSVLEYCWEAMPFYQELWGAAGVGPGHLKTSADIVKLPTWDKYTQRAEIEKHPPIGSYYVNRNVKDAAYLLSSGGTTGKARVFPILDGDLPGLQDLQVRTLDYAGVRPDDIVQVCTHYSAFAGAWCGTWAVRGLGAALVPAGSGRSLPSVRQVELIQAMGVTVLRAQPSYAERLAEVAIEMGLEPRDLGVRVIVTAGESYSSTKRARLQELWGASVRDFFGSADTFAWSSVDCEHSESLLGQSGMHVWEDACIVEILREDGTPCDSGEYGELTLTTLNWRNSPRIRYRTGDLAAVHKERCGCGWHTFRMSPIRGRVDHVVRIKGINIYPDVLDNVMRGSVPWVREYYAVAEHTDQSDVLRIFVEVDDPLGQQSGDEVRAAVVRQLGVTAIVEQVARGDTLGKTGVEGDLNKPRRLFDNRKYGG